MAKTFLYFPLKSKLFYIFINRELSRLKYCDKVTFEMRRNSSWIMHDIWKMWFDARMKWNSIFTSELLEEIWSFCWSESFFTFFVSLKICETVNRLNLFNWENGVNLNRPSATRDNIQNTLRFLQKKNSKMNHWIHMRRHWTSFLF